jgi:hypothetical protein
MSMNMSCLYNDTNSKALRAQHNAADIPQPRAVYRQQNDLQRYIPCKRLTIFSELQELRNKRDAEDIDMGAIDVEKYHRLLYLAVDPHWDASMGDATFTIVAETDGDWAAYTQSKPSKSVTWTKPP